MAKRVHSSLEYARHGRPEAPMPRSREAPGTKAVRLQRRILPARLANLIGGPMPAFLFNASANGQQRIYLDESGTLGFGGEIFTMAMVLVRDLPKLEACTLRNRTTQSEVKASQMKTAQKLALARTLLEENDIEVYLVKLDPHAAMASERKLDKELLYDSMVAQALSFYLSRGDMARDLPYRISMDMRGGLRESYEDMVAESVGNVLMHRSDPLVTALDVRFLDSKYSAGVQAADLFSNVYRTALTQTDSPCRSFLRKYQELGRVHAGFTFGLVELADQMAQIAADLRARVLLEGAVTVLDDGLSPSPSKTVEEKIIDVVEEILEPADTPSDIVETEPRGTSRSARRRRSRATRRIHAAGQEASSDRTSLPEQGGEDQQTATPAPQPEEDAPSAPAAPSSEPEVAPAASDSADRPNVEMPEPQETPAPRRATRTRTHRSRTGAAKKATTDSQGVEMNRTADATPPAATGADQNAAPAEKAPLEEPRQHPSSASEAEHPAPSEAPDVSGTTGEQEPAAVDSPKPDVRPGRASRSRQAAQATSRRQRASKKPVVKPEAAPDSERSPEPAPASATDSVPPIAAPSPAVETAASTAKSDVAEQPVPPAAASTGDAPAKKSPSRRRRRTAAKPEPTQAEASHPAADGATDAPNAAPAAPEPKGSPEAAPAQE